MHRRDFIKASFVASFAAASGNLFAAESRKKPNFVIIFIDDMGYGDIGPFGQKVIKTPNLDRMASEGMKFTSFYSSFPLCSPSRVSLLTGCYPIRVSIPRVFFPDDIYGMNPKEITIADVLKDQGYATMCIGKWHVGHKVEFLPTRQGFDHFVGLSHSNNNSLDPTAPIAEDANLHDWTRKRIKTEKLEKNTVPLYRDEEVVEYPVNQDTLTKLYTNEAIKFMETNKDRPFFLYLPHTMVHGPLAASADFRGKSKGGLYGDAVEELDWSTGQILDFLREKGLDENTYVIFTSDNGPWLTPDLSQGSPGPLRSGKGSTYEGGMRVPTIMWWPGTIPAATVCDEVAGTIDMMPTLARLAGTNEPGDRIIDGHDIRPLIMGNEGAHSAKDSTGYYYYGHGSRLQAVRLGKWKLHRARGKHELYDLEADIGEQNNLAEKEPERVKRLTTMMNEFDAKLKANQRPAGAEGGKDTFDISRK
ncbi:sulfatase family protein [Sedimentisphaera salicampi]|uniref:sulfatase family protein n=1 Tax=Sedimentisphaera salicampi TaxID=1941349 RepID=UPI000B9D30B6|nr:sulfatase [Sedimentisphaera salicampi]OXU16030.1 Arylsulfatase [Sedimentisphaera salicampi]